MGKITTGLSNAKSKLKKSLEKSKGKLVAGMLAGSILLTSSLFGCEQRNTGDNEELRAEIANMQVKNKSHEEQIALLKQEIANLKEISTANSTRLAKVEELLTILEQSGASDEELTASINVLMAEIQKQSDATVNKVLKELEKNNVSEETKEDLIAILTNLNDEVVYGIRTDYKETFLQAEKIEDAVKKQKANNEITEEQFNNFIDKIHEVQGNVIRVAVYKGCTSLTDKTGHTQLEAAVDDASGIGYARMVFGDKENTSSLKSAYKSNTNGETRTQLAHYDSKGCMYAENDNAWSESTPSPVSPVNIYNFASMIIDLPLSHKVVDYDYSVIDGYSIVHNNYNAKKQNESLIQQSGIFNVKFAEDGSLQTITETRNIEESTEGKLIGLDAVTEYKFSSLTQEEFEDFCKAVKNELQAKLDKQSGSE